MDFIPHKPDIARGAAVTIGNFDGVHLGHRTLINRMLEKARDKGLASLVACFDPHPLRVLVGPRTPPFLTTTAQKIEYIRELGVDAVVVFEFTKAFAATEPADFAREILAETLNAKELVIGYDYNFGKSRKGDFAALSAFGHRLGFGVEQLGPVLIGGAPASSTRVRDLVKAGDVWDAGKVLGRFYAVRGVVGKGFNRGGRLLGFPTANLHLENELPPPPGVYAGFAVLGDRTLQAAVNLGWNPTFENPEPSVEAHILDFNEDIYGQRLELRFVQRLRPEKRFDSLDALIEMIREDVALTRAVLAEVGEAPARSIDEPDGPE